MRLIDADALLEHFKTTDRYFAVKYDIEQAPTIDQPRGEWIETDSADEIYGIDEKCTNCGALVLSTHMCYCGNCGAKMKEGETNG